MAKKAKDESADDAVDVQSDDVQPEPAAPVAVPEPPAPDPDVVVLSQPQNAELMAAVLRYVAASPRAVDTVGAQLNTAPENVTRLCGVLAESLGRLAGTLD